MKNTAPHTCYTHRNSKPTPPDIEMKSSNRNTAAFSSLKFLGLYKNINSEAEKPVDDDGNITAKRRLKM
jgi:hypothetical protein